MKDPLSAQDEALLQRVVGGELDPQAPEVQVRRAASPAFAGALDDWRALSGLLGSVRAEDERLIETATEDVQPEDRRLVRETVLHLQGSAARRGRRLRILTAAAAVLLGVVAIWRFSVSEPEPSPSGLLGTEGCVAPLGRTTSFASFVVDVRMEPLWSLHIVVYDATGSEILRSPSLESPRWDLTPEQLRRLEAEPRISWSFDVLGPSGEPRASGGPCEARRSD